MESVEKTNHSILQNGFASVRKVLQRPPWTSENRIREHCTSCGKCIADCPEAILVAGPAGTPVLDFALGVCTLCGTCSISCEEPVFTNLENQPWKQKAAIANDCFLNAGIACQVCTDSCDQDALFFDMRTGVAGAIRVSEEACNGCGACVSACPVQAITCVESDGGRS